MPKPTPSCKRLTRRSNCARKKPSPLLLPAPARALPPTIFFSEEAYQVLRLQVKRMQFELRDYYQQKRQQYEAEMKKEMMSAIPAPQPLAESA